MTYPASDVNTSNADASTDSPATFRTDVLDLITKFNLLRNHIPAFMQGLLDDTSASVARTTLGAAASAANADITSMSALTSINGGPLGGLHNLVINGGFTVNQASYASAGALAAGIYGHDGWKAGAGGGNYSFTQLASDTTITIAASKTLIQVIEDVAVQSTSYVLSWSGTALARYAVNSATPAGAYAASPILISGQSAGVTMSIEFGNGAATGTLGKVQLERGTSAAQATSFEQRPLGLELALCQRYQFAYSGGGTGFANGSTVAEVGIQFPVVMRAAPTLVAGTTLQTVNWSGGSSLNPTSISVGTLFAGTRGASLRFNNFVGLTSGQGLVLQGLSGVSAFFRSQL